MEIHNFDPDKLDTIYSYIQESTSNWPKYMPPPKEEIDFIGQKNPDLLLYMTIDTEILGVVLADLRSEYDTMVLSFYFPVCSAVNILETLVNELVARIGIDHFDKIIFGVHQDYGMSHLLPGLFRSSQPLFDISRVYITVDESTMDRFYQYKDLQEYHYQDDEENLGNLFKHYFRWSDRMLDLHLEIYRDLSSPQMIHQFLKEEDRLTGRMFLNAEDEMGKGAIVVAGTDKLKDFESMLAAMLQFARDNTLQKVGLPISGITYDELKEYPLDVFHKIRYFETSVKNY